MRFINVKETTGKVAWVNFDHVHIIHEMAHNDLCNENFLEGAKAFDEANLVVFAICIRGPNGWWKVLTRETPNSLRFRAEEGQMLDTSGDGFISKDLK